MSEPTAGNGAGPATEASIGELLAGISRDVSSLVRAEVELAKAELKVSARRAALGGAMFAAAASLGALALVLALVAAADGLVALWLAPGWAFLLVAAALLLVAGILGALGAASVRRVHPPQRAAATTKQTVANLRRRSTSR